MVRPIAAGNITRASYSSSRQRARRRYCSAFPGTMGLIPIQVLSSTRRETCMGRPSTAGKTGKTERASFLRSLRDPTPAELGAGAGAQGLGFEEQRGSRNQLRRKIMPGKTFLMKRSAMLVLLGFGVLLGAARAQTESVLHSFCTRINCNDGEGLQAGLLLDQQGNLYGTTNTGGPYDLCGRGEGCGLVFKLSPKGKETVLYDFCERGYPCTDGGNPLAGLTFDQKGNLYGTTEYGGAHGEGVAFKLTPEGKYAVLYSFCARDNCTDGYHPA